MKENIENNGKVDFVLLWVDGNDEEWIKEKNKYKDKIDEEEQCRFRDWDNLMYWFRGVEKFAPWVNNIFFITYGHLPKWLNIENPKLKIINHKDFIPEQYLPTFNSNTIELNLHRIKELSERFVLFNDDIFITKKIQKEELFKNGLPKEVFIEDINAPFNTEDDFSNVVFNNMKIINKYFDKRKVTKQNFRKIFSLKYGINIIRNILLLPWSRYSGIKDQHICVPILKSTIQELWDKEFEILDMTSKQKFRSENNVNQYLCRYWQLMQGKFYPRKYNFGKMYTISENNQQIIKVIEKQKYKILCLNDSKYIKEFEKSKEEIKQALDKILDNKSHFEI